MQQPSSSQALVDRQPCKRLFQWKTNNNNDVGVDVGVDVGGGKENNGAVWLGSTLQRAEQRLHRTEEQLDKSLELFFRKASSSGVAAAASVRSNCGGGIYGYLQLVIGNEAFNNLPNFQPWEDPIHPGNTPTFAGGETGPQIARIVAQHQEEMRKYREFRNLSDVLKKMLIAAVDDDYLSPLKDRFTGYANVTVRNMLQHILTNYGEIDAPRLDKNETNMRKPWDPSTPIQKLFTQLKDGQKFAMEANIEYNDRQMIAFTYPLIYKMGLFFSDCKKWDEMIAVPKTWANFKIHFTNAYRRHQDCQISTAKQCGYGAMAWESEKEQLAAALVNLAEAITDDHRVNAMLSGVNAMLSATAAEQQSKIWTWRSRWQN